MSQPPTKGHFTRETENLWPLHFKHSHWWKQRSRSKFASYYAWGTNGVCECKMDVKFTWISTWHQMVHVSWSLGLFSYSPFGGRSNTKLGDHVTPNAYNHWFILFYHVWGPAWIDIHWNSILLRARSHYTWGTMTTLHDFEVSWDGLWTLSFGLLARVWSGPKWLK